MAPVEVNRGSEVAWGDPNLDGPMNGHKGGSRRYRCRDGNGAHRRREG